MKKWLMDYLSVSRKERSGFVILLLLVFSIWLLPRYFSRGNADTSLLLKADAVMAAARMESVSVVRPSRLFAFDPNTLSDDGWLDLGLSEKNVRTIRNYLNKGGRFRDAADIHRIYGIRSDLAGKLEPYIRIRDPQMQTNKWRPAPPLGSTSSARREHYTNGTPPERRDFRQYRNTTREVIDVNESDTSDWIALPGIGSKLAARVILFREKCGGFHEVEQVGEVYGLSDSVFRLIRPMLKVGGTSLRTLRINHVNADSLSMHPYITGSEARAIVKYRQQHGVFKDPEELLAIAIITKEWIEKLKPYLDFN